MRLFWRYLRVIILLLAYSYILIFRGHDGGPLVLVFFQDLFGRWPEAQVPGWCGYALFLAAPLVNSDRIYARLFSVAWLCLVVALVVVLSGADLLVETLISGSPFVVLGVALPWYEWFRAGLESAGLR
jgi:hypothetical protein